MSQEETKKQEEATQDKQSTSTKATTSSSPPQPQPEADDNIADHNNEELIIDQVRNELETYFAPQNIQNDFNLRQKMTTDGYIDIDLLLDLKLISDLVSNREILIEAIARSKLLVMNTGCTMVKYMPLLERNVLILRDIATSTKQEQILSIFNNENCSQPSEIHSDIGNNWFCQFKTEEECLNTAKYLQQFGTFNQDKLHVRVKAIHDKNKADTSPQMQPSPPPPPPPPQQIPYAQGYYGGNPSYYYGVPQGAPPPPPPMIDPYYAPPRAPAPPNKGSPRARNNKRTRTDDVVGGIGDDVVVVEETGGTEEDPARTAISDYPGVFDKYTQQEFLDIYGAMKESDLEIPQSMRGRDSRIVSEETMIPDVLMAKVKEEESGNKKKSDDMDGMDVKGKGNKGKRRGKNKNNYYNNSYDNYNAEREKTEMQGTYYEEEVYGDDYGYAEDDYYYEEQGYYDRSYNNNRSRSSNKYYYENNNQSQSRKQTQNQRQSPSRSSQRAYNNRRRGGGGGRSRSRGRGRSYRGRRRGGYGYGSYGSSGGGGGRKYQSRKRENNNYYYDEKYEKYETYEKSQSQSQSRSQYQKTYTAHWSPRPAKHYNTNKGVYRTKTVSSAY